MSQTLQGTVTGELIGDVSMFKRRIEYLEELAAERNRQLCNEQEPFRREIERLKNELMAERSLRANQISKKNAEIAFFK